jgi:hypothetical protein
MGPCRRPILFCRIVSVRLEPVSSRWCIPLFIWKIHAVDDVMSDHCPDVRSVSGT